MAPLPAWGRVPVSRCRGRGGDLQKGDGREGENSHLVSAKKPSRAPGQVRVGGGGVAGEKCHVLRLAGRPLAAFPFILGRKAKHHGRVLAEGIPGASLVGRALLVTSGCGGGRVGRSAFLTLSSPGCFFFFLNLLN